MNLIKRNSYRICPVLETMECRALLTAGALDPSFGNQGTTITSFAGSLSGAASVVVQPWDNKSIVACVDYDGGYKFALARYNSNGSLDTTFGNGGTVATLLGTKGNMSNGIIKQILLTPDQKILAVGYSDNGKQSVALARFNSNGTLDTTFGSSGEVITSMTGKNASGAGLAAAFDPSGKIIVAGKANGTPLLLRYTSNGSLDTTFGNKGMVLGTSGSNVYDQWQTLQIQPVGNSYQIVTAGFDGADGHGTIAHFDAKGALVATFGTKGEVAVNLPGGGTTVPMIFQPDGKLVAVHETGLTDDSIILNRFNADGAPDGGFGTGGQVVTYVSSLFGGGIQNSASPYSIGIDPSNRIVLAGRALGDDGWVNSLLVRYTSTGAIDSSFGTNGAVRTLVGGTLGGEEERYTALAFQTDGRIIAAGYVTTAYNPISGSSTTLALEIARYDSDTTTVIASAPLSYSAAAPSTPDPGLVPLALDSPDFWGAPQPLSKRSRTH